MGKRLGVGAALCMVALLFGCARPPAVYLPDLLRQQALDAQPAPDPGVCLILTHSAPEGSLTHQAAQHLAQRVSALSQQTLQIRIYPEDTLGDLDDGRWYFSNGAVDMRIGAGPSRVLPVVLWLPLLTDMTQADIAACLQPGQPLRELIAQTDEDTVLLGVLPPTDRVLSSQWSIQDVSNLSGVEMRVFQSALEQDFWQRLGANTVTIPMQGVYLALQQGLIQAQENPLHLIRGYRLHEHQNYILRTNFKVYLEAIYINRAVFDGLSADHQAVLCQAAEDTFQEMAPVFQEYQVQSADYLRTSGLITRDLDPEERQRVQSLALTLVEETLRRQTGADLYQQVLDAVSGDSD